MRRSNGWAVVLALTVTLTACGNAAESDAGAEPESGQTTTSQTVDASSAGTTTTVEETTTTAVASTTTTVSTSAASDDGSQPEALDEGAVDGLLWMREEEKLARDVYLALSEMWSFPIFENIAGSEQHHTDAVGELLVRYDIDDPMAVDVAGVFQDPTIQDLYDDLVVQGGQSLVDALIVGATIEDMDIVDLQLRRTGVTAIDDVYANLEKGSRNHLRAFLRTLERQGGGYTPAFLSPEEFDSIVSSPTERGPAGG